MKFIYEKIISLFPDINWKTLGYENSPRIRFYFDGTKKDLSDIKSLSTDIVQDIFKGRPIFIAMTFFSSNSEIDKYTIESLKNRGLLDILDAEESKVLQIEENVCWYYYFTQIKDSEIEKINKTIIEIDFAINPLLQLHCYYFCPENHIMINLYDDRGMDVISDNFLTLNAIKKVWEDKILVKFEHQ